MKLFGVVCFVYFRLFSVVLCDELEPPSHIPGFQFTPNKQAVVLLGQTINLDLFLPDAQPLCIKVVTEDRKPTSYVRIFPKENCLQLQNSRNTSSTRLQFQITGLKTGRQKVSFYAYKQNNENKSIYAINDDFEVLVVEQLNVIHDAFIYILASIQFLAMLLLGLRMRGAATKEVLIHPCALIAALLCQVMCLPLIFLGVSLALGLGELPTIALLIVGCCPSAVVSCMLAVVQQAHVELAVVLLILQTVTTLGTMPGWLFTYGHVLGIAYAEVAFPYLHIAAATAAVALPTIIGITLRRCTPRVLPQLDKAIQPVSLLVVMVAVTVSIYNFIEKFPLITWRLLIAAAIIPCACLLSGATLCIIFRQKIPQTKTVGMVTALQNTLLAATIIQTSYPVEKSSVMAVTLACLDFMTLGSMFLMYAVHILLWVVWPMYRVHHDNIGISGISKSFSERLVRNMLRAGEIRFCSRAYHKRKADTSGNRPYCDVGSMASDRKLNGSRVNIEKIGIANNSRMKGLVNPLGGLNLAFLGLSTSFKKKGKTGSVVDNTDSESDLSLHYFASPQASPLITGVKPQNVNMSDVTTTTVVNATRSNENTLSHVCTGSGQCADKSTESNVLTSAPAESNAPNQSNNIASRMETNSPPQNTVFDEGHYENCSQKHNISMGEICHCAREDESKSCPVEIMADDVRNTNQSNNALVPRVGNGESITQKANGQSYNASRNNSDNICPRSTNEEEYSNEVAIDNQNEDKNNPAILTDSFVQNDSSNQRKENGAQKCILNPVYGAQERMLNPVHGAQERILNPVDPMFENQMNEQSETECSIWLEEKM